MIIKICGIPHKVQEVPVINEESEGITQGMILFSEAKILLKQDLPNELKESVLFHEVLHGILTLTGYLELSGDEAFVQCLSNVMYQMFDIKKSIINDD